MCILYCSNIKISLKPVPCPKRELRTRVLPPVLKESPRHHSPQSPRSLPAVPPHPALHRSPSALLPGRPELACSPWRPSLLPHTSRQSWKNDMLKSPLHFGSALLRKAAVRALAAKTRRIRQRTSIGFATWHLSENEARTHLGTFASLWSI